MSRIVFKIALSLCFGLSLACSQFKATSQSQGGGATDVGGGGDDKVAELLESANTLSELLFSVSESTLIVLTGDPIFAQNFYNTLVNTKISSTDSELILKGREVTAINYPETLKLIFNRSRWGELYPDEISRFELIAHEFLGLMKIEDDSYEVSSQLIEAVYGLPIVCNGDYSLAAGGRQGILQIQSATNGIVSGFLFGYPLTGNCQSGSLSFQSNYKGKLLEFTGKVSLLGQIEGFYSENNKGSHQWNAEIITKTEDSILNRNTLKLNQCSAISAVGINTQDTNVSMRKILLPHSKAPYDHTDGGNLNFASGGAMVYGYTCRAGNSYFKEIEVLSSVQNDNPLHVRTINVCRETRTLYYGYIPNYGYILNATNGIANDTTCTRYESVEVLKPESGCSNIGYAYNCKNPKGIAHHDGGLAAAGWGGTVHSYVCGEVEIVPVCAR